MKFDGWLHNIYFLLIIQRGFGCCCLCPSYRGHIIFVINWPILLALWMWLGEDMHLDCWMSIILIVLNLLDSWVLSIVVSEMKLLGLGSHEELIYPYKFCNTNPKLLIFYNSTVTISSFCCNSSIEIWGFACECDDGKRTSFSNCWIDHLKMDVLDVGIFWKFLTHLV